MKIIVTDLTRFQNPDIVCLAGIDPITGTCVRPMILNGAKLDYFPFKSVKQHKLIPGSYLNGDFLPAPTAEPPHTEDHQAAGTTTIEGSASGEKFQSVLENSSHTSVRSAFGSKPDGRRYAKKNAPTISLATIKIDNPRNQFRLVVDRKYGPPKFKAHIVDGNGFELSWIPVTDLGFADHIQSVLTQDPTLTQLNDFLGQQKNLYLRLGLTREWGPSPDRLGYWIQLNGIYSFPNFREDLRIYE